MREQLGAAPSRPLDAVDKAYVDAVVSDLTGASIATVTGEAPAGTKNGINETFTLANTFVAKSTAVYRNGLREVLGVGYSENAPNEIIFTTAPLDTDILTVDYTVAS